MEIFYIDWKVQIILIMILGLVLASFLQALVFRIENFNNWNEILTARSRCESCGKVLTPLELIPVVSYILQGGRCKKCSKKIGFITLIIEITLPLAYLLLYYYDSSFTFYIFTTLFFFITIYDWKYQQIPKVLIQFLLLFSVILFFINFHLNPTTGFEQGPIVAALLALFLYLINLIKPSFGFGDVLILLSLGFITYRYDPILIFLIANISAIVFYLPAILRDRKFLQKRVAFIPFLFIGFLISMVFSAKFNEYLVDVIKALEFYLQNS